MSEGIFVALIGFIGAILGALIAGVLPLLGRAGRIPISWSLLLLSAAIGAAVGLVLGITLAPSQASITSNTSTPARPTTLASVTPYVPTPTSPLIAINLVNDNCHAEEIYVDERLVISSLAGGKMAILHVAPGQHYFQTCESGTKNCSDKLLQNWTTSLTYSIARSPNCPITINVVNNNCHAEEIYLDGGLVAPSLAQGATIVLQVTQGQHYFQTCASGTKNCSDKKLQNWTTSLTFSIARDSDCR